MPLYLPLCFGQVGPPSMLSILILQGDHRNDISGWQHLVIRLCYCVAGPYVWFRSESTSQTFAICCWHPWSPAFVFLLAVDCFPSVAGTVSDDPVLLPFLLKMRPCFCSHDLVMNAVCWHLCCCCCVHSCCNRMFTRLQEIVNNDKADSAYTQY